MTPSRWALACVIALVGVLGGLRAAPAGAAELLVQRQPGVGPDQRVALREHAGVAHRRTLAGPGAELVSVPDSRAGAALKALNADPGVEYAVPNGRLRIASTSAPSDAWWSLQYGFESANDADIDLLAAWKHPGNPLGDGVKVGVVDQQIYADHPDLLGQVDTAMGTDLMTSSDCTAPAPTGHADHGTHIAGLIAAALDNPDEGKTYGHGITGVAPEAKVVPIRAFDNCGYGDAEDVHDALVYAGERHLPVVVASFSTDPLVDAPGYSEMFADIFDRYPDTLFVVAAGNQGSYDTSEHPVYPCDARTPGSRFGPANLICVGMSDRNDAPDCQSNVGGQVDVFAPGRQIYSTVRPVAGSKTDIVANDGTSMSAAIVAGIAALVKAAQPDGDGADLKTALLEDVDEQPEMVGLARSAGRINAARSLGETVDSFGWPLGPGGPGAGHPWVSCDADHDGFPYGGPARYVADRCPTLAGSFNGCPDADEDGVLDAVDNCPGKANPLQEDLDRDGVGDVCDPDPDGDAVSGAADVCPQTYARTVNGCPPSQPVIEDPVVDPPPAETPLATPIPIATPVATPVAPVEVKVTIAVKVTKGVAKVTVKSSRAARFSVKFETLRGKKWKRWTTRSVAANKVFKVKKLPKGKWRATATATGLKTAVKKFRV